MSEGDATDPTGIEPDAAPGAEAADVDDREAMERIAESMAELMRRMLEFQEEMKPFLPLLAEVAEEGSAPEEPTRDDP